MTNPISEERLRNTLAWATARLGQLSGAEVIVGAITELLERRVEVEKYKAWAAACDEPTKKPADLSYDEFWQKVRETGWNPNQNDLRALLILWESEGGSSPNRPAEPT